MHLGRERDAGTYGLSAEREADVAGIGYVGDAFRGLSGPRRPPSRLRRGWIPHHVGGSRSRPSRDRNDGIRLCPGGLRVSQSLCSEESPIRQADRAKFQVIAFKLADMVLKIELARDLLYKACWLVDHARPFQMESAMAKLYCSEIAREIADEAVQVHGGYGLMKEYEIERFYRDQRSLQIGEGTSEIQRLVISRLIGC